MRGSGSRLDSVDGLPGILTECADPRCRWFVRESRGGCGCVVLLQVRFIRTIYEHEAKQATSGAGYGGRDSDFGLG